MDEAPQESAKRVPPEALDVEAFRSGDGPTIRTLVETVAGWARGQGLSPEDAEDVAADAVRRAHERIDSFRGESTLAGWVLGIAKHVLADLLRQREKAHTLSLDDTRIEPVPDEDVIELAFGQLVAEEALSSLSDDERQAIELVAFRGLGNDEGAAEMGKTYDGFTCLLYRARRKVGRFVEDNS